MQKGWCGGNMGHCRLGPKEIDGLFVLPGKANNKYLDIAVGVFKNDSQRGSILSRNRVGDDPR